MSIFAPNNAGTVRFNNGSTTIEGAGTFFMNYRAGSSISIPGIGSMMLAADPVSDTEAEGVVAWAGATTAFGAFEYMPRNEEGVFTDKLIALLRQLSDGNLQALAELEFAANKVLGVAGPGALKLIDRSELIAGVHFNARVADQAGLVPYAGRPGPDGDEPGFTVLVEDWGDGRAALVSKASDTHGDWTDPAFISGPTGPTPEVEVGDTTTLAPGEAATVTPTAIPGGVSLDFGIPAGRGVTFKGEYNPAIAYILDDAVLFNGSAWIALQATTGNAPPVLPATSNAWWQLMARRGEDGAGTVSTVAEGDGISVDLTDPTAPEVSVVLFTGDSGSGGALGGVPAPAAGDAAARKVLGASGGWVDPIQPGRIVNSWVGGYGINTTLASVIPFDDTQPQSTEGTAVILVPITPSKATNLIRARFIGFGGGAGDNAIIVALFRGGDTTPFAVSADNPAGSGYVTAIPCSGNIFAGTTSTINIVARVGPSGGAGIRLNGSISGRAFGGAAYCELVVEEIEV